MTTVASFRIKFKTTQVHYCKDRSIVIHISPEKQLNSGDSEVEIRIISIRWKDDIAGSIDAFDSAGKVDDSSFSPFFVELANEKFKAKLSPDGAIRPLDDLDKSIEKLLETSSHRSVVKSLISSTSIPKMLPPVKDFFPRTPLQIGETWKRAKPSDKDAWLREDTLQYHSKVGPIHEFRSTIAMKHSREDLESTGKGIFRFDEERGRMLDSIEEFHLTASNGEGISSTEVTASIRVRTLDKNPVLPK